MTTVESFIICCDWTASGGITGGCGAFGSRCRHGDTCSGSAYTFRHYTVGRSLVSQSVVGGRDRCLHGPGGGIWEPSKHRPVWIPWAVGCCMIILETILAVGDSPGPPGKGLIIQSRVCDGPVQVLPHQSLPPKLPVVTDPP